MLDSAAAISASNLLILASSRLCSFILCSTAGLTSDTEGGITAGTSLSFSWGGRKEGQKMRGAISINTSPDKDPSGGTEKSVEGGGQLLASMLDH